MHHVQRSPLPSAVSTRRNGPAFAALAVAIALGLGANAQAATFTVVNNNNDGAGSLRAAIDEANLAAGADIIAFDAAVTGSILLESQIGISDDLRILGPGLATLALDGGENNRIFDIAPPDGSESLAVSIEGLTLRNGFSGGSGGCVNADATALEVVDSLITGCVAGEGSGGGIAVTAYGYDPKAAKGPPPIGASSLVLRGTRVENNSALRSGGGVSAMIFAGAEVPDGFRLIDGSSVTGNETRFGGPGGGVEVFGFSPFAIEVRDSTISGNTAESYLGGGFVVYQDQSAASSIVVADSTISNNRLTLSYSGPFLYGGGGVALLTGANVQISNSTFENNAVGEGPKFATGRRAAKGGVPAMGGGILLQPSDSMPSLTLTGSRIAGNSAPYGGGAGLLGVEPYLGSPGKAQRVGFWRARARNTGDGTTPSGKGEPSVAQFNVSDTVFDNNTASAGAAIFSFIAPSQSPPPQPPPGKGILPPPAVFERVTLRDNTAIGGGDFGDEGGALFTISVGLPLQLINSTISGNTGGGVTAFRYTDMPGESLLVDNSTIVGNAGSGIGGAAPTMPPPRWKSLLAGAKHRLGDKAYPAQSFPNAIRNSIVQGNTGIDSEAADITSDPVGIHLLHNLIGMAEADLAGYDDGGGNQFGVADAVLGPLADNGGNTPTHLPLAGSPAIDAGDPAFSEPPATDQRGAPRIAGVALDIGAVEAVPPVPGTLQFDPASVTVNEPDGTVMLTVTRTGGDDGEVGISFATAEGTATADLDFTSTADTLTWADGDSAAKTVTVPIIDDAEIESDETFAVALSDPTGNATLGSAFSATVTIVSDDVALPGSLQFDPASAIVNEADGTVALTVTRVGGDDGAVGVNFATAEGTASGGLDFTPTAGTLSWADGDSTARTVNVPILDDDEIEANETFAVTLTASTGDATLGSGTSASVTIVSDDQAVPGVLGFDPTSYVVDEAAGTATLTVERSGGSDGAVAVEFTSSAGSATAGDDYTTSNGTLNWADGDTAAKTISVPILDDGDDEADETFGVTLAAASGGATLASANATVTITDNDDAGVVSFDGADEDGVLRLRINEDGSTAAPAKGLLTISVVRTAGSAGPASVAFETVNGTATAPSDFIAASGVLTWADGDTSAKSIVVDIVEDSGNPEPDETFSVVLSNAQGAGLDGNPQAQIVIVANGTVQPPPATVAAVIPAADWRGKIALFGALLVAGWVALRKRF